MRTLCNKSLVFWNWIIRTCKSFKLCGGVIKKQNKTKPSSKCFANGGLNIEGLFSLHCGILSRSVQDFFFFLRKVFEVRETGNPEVPLYFGEGLRRSLGNAAGCGGGGQMGCAGLSFAFMFLCVETQLGAISWCVRISQTNLELSNAFVPEEMFVLSDVNILCISAGLWLQVGSPNRLRSDLNKTVCFPRTLFS